MQLISDIVVSALFIGLLLYNIFVHMFTYRICYGGKRVKMSKYKDIADDIENKIHSHFYSEQLPDQHELAEIYATSRVTIVRALKLLSKRNLVKTVKGHGTFIVSKTLPDVFLNFDATDNKGYSHSLQGKLDVSNKLISYKMRMPSNTEVDSLQIEAHDLVYDICRMHAVNQKEINLEYIIIPVNRIPGLTEKVAAQSIYAHVKNDLKFGIGKSSCIVTAQKADSYDIRYLNCQADDPILCLHQKNFLVDGRPFELSESHIRFDRGSVSFENDPLVNQYPLDYEP